VIQTHKHPGDLGVLRGSKSYDTAESLAEPNMKQKLSDSRFLACKIST
jgi:hypothetical protein